MHNKARMNLHSFVVQQKKMFMECITDFGAVHCLADAIVVTVIMWGVDSG